MFLEDNDKQFIYELNITNLKPKTNKTSIIHKAAWMNWSIKQNK